MLKLARPSVIILLHQKGPGPASSRERPRSLTSPPPAEAPSPRAGLARPPAPARLPRLSPPGPPRRGTRPPPGGAGCLTAPGGRRAGRRRGHLPPLPLEKWCEEVGSGPPTGSGPGPARPLAPSRPKSAPLPAQVPGTAPVLWLAQSGQSGFFAGREAGRGNRLSAPPPRVGFGLELAPR